MAVVIGLIGAAAIIISNPARSSATDISGLQAAAPVMPSGLQDAAAPVAQVAPPKPGTYRQESVTTIEGNSYGGSSTQRRDIEYEIQTVTADDAPGETRLRYDSGGGNYIELWWRADSVVLGRSRFARSSECTFEVPVVVYQLPLDIGRSWESSGSCTPSGDGFATNQRSTTTVTGTKRITVGDTDVDVLVLERQSTIKQVGKMGGAEMSAQIEQRDVELFSPAHGLPVLTTSSSVASFSGGGESNVGRQTNEIRLLSVTPEEM